MNPRLIALTVIALSSVVIGMLFRRFRSRRLPWTSDPQFVRHMRAAHVIDAENDAILQIRDKIADVLKVDPHRLAPEMTGEYLRRKIGYLWEFPVAWSDLVDEANDALGNRDPVSISDLVEAYCRTDASNNP